jgi:hypothetical protein
MLVEAVVEQEVMELLALEELAVVVLVQQIQRELLELLILAVEVEVVEISPQRDMTVELVALAL